MGDTMGEDARREMVSTRQDVRHDGRSHPANARTATVGPDRLARGRSGRSLAVGVLVAALHFHLHVSDHRGNGMLFLQLPLRLRLVRLL